MAARETTLNDHHERLNRVLVYIQESSDQPLTLDRLAAVAHFSSFHFHRIFAAFVGETVSGYVRRIRLDRAAMKIYSTDDPITSIALSAGYETPAAFAKAFKQRFGKSPTEYKKIKREQVEPPPAAAGGSPQHRDLPELLTRDASFFTVARKRFPPPAGAGGCQGAGLPATAGLPDNRRRERSMADMKPEIRTIPEQKVLFVRKTGPYAQAASEAWSALMKFAYSHRLITKGTKGIGISHDSPDITPEDKIRYDACITVQEAVNPKGEVGLQTIVGGKYAVFLHKGPYDKLGKTYNAIFSQWLPESGEKLREAPCFEVYLNRDPRRTRPENLRTEMYIPIQ